MSNAILIPLVVFIILFLIVERVPANAHVIDGDTIKVDGLKWRLSGFDAPESNQPGGSEATAKLRGIVANERLWVILRHPDVYGRPLATIHTRYGPLSWRMIATGNAHGEGLIGGFLTIFAHTFRRGMWAKGNVISPRTWREDHPQYRGSQRPAETFVSTGVVRRLPGRRPAKASQHMRVMDHDGYIGGDDGSTNTDYRRHIGTLTDRAYE